VSDLFQAEKADNHAIAADASTRQAVQTIVIADTAMGIENVPTIGGAAHGNMVLVVIGLLGWWAVIRYRLGLLSLEEALAKLSKRLGLRMRAVILPYANAAIDVDSIADLMLVQGALEKAAAEDA
jgi:predicted tellurium resistance membrane protein TerC